MTKKQNYICTALPVTTKQRDKNNSTQEESEATNN